MDDAIAYASEVENLRTLHKQLVSDHVGSKTEAPQTG